MPPVEEVLQRTAEVAIEGAETGTPAKEAVNLDSIWTTTTKQEMVRDSGIVNAIVRARTATVSIEAKHPMVHHVHLIAS